MQLSTLIKRNLTHYWRTNLAVVFGVATAVAVLAGALLVGDSVRASLRSLFLLRLGNTDHVISATSFFRERLADDLQSKDGFKSRFTAACPLIAFEGVVTHEESGRRAGGVQVYGVDERFWKFHGQQEAGSAPGDRDILVSASLAQELVSKAGDSLLLRVEKPSAIPTESLHGRKEDVGRTIRLTAREALRISALGEFSIRPQQSAVRAVFVSLARLQKDLSQPGKVNVILVSESSSKAEAGPAAESLERLLSETFTLEDLGLKLRALEDQQCISLESDSALINDQLKDTAQAAASGLGMRASYILSYLANSIRSGGREVPYSLVTALDQESLQRLSKPEAQPIASQSMKSDAINLSQRLEPPIVLNEWAASDLGVKPGDSIQLEYYVWQQEGRLETKEANFEVIAITPIEGIAADRNLTPEYPGITETESLSDWDPPFPIDLARVRPRDEDYWDKYRTTPKAFVRLGDGQRLWASRFGNLTSIRIFSSGGGDLETALASYRQGLRAALDPIQMGLAVHPARAQGVDAARGATDFGEYFLYFSFFLVVSALLLTALFFKLGIEQRVREIGLLRAVGFPAAQIRRLFLSEGALLAVTGSVVGLLGAVGYGALMMLGLRTWWVGAVGTTMLTLHVSPVSLALGGAGGVLAALVCVVWTLRSLAPASPRSLLAGSIESKRRRGKKEDKSRLLARFFSLPIIAASSLALGLMLMIAAVMDRVGAVAGFFGAGTLLLIALLCYQSIWLRQDKRRLLDGIGLWAISRLGFRNAMHRPGRSALCITLIASATFIIVAVDAFRRDSADDLLDKKSGSGGYTLLAESLLPIVHDVNSAEGREALTLGLQENSALEAVTFTRFRLRPGDDASCLNLYQPRNPRVLAPADDFIPSNRFAFGDSLAASAEEKANPWLLLNREEADGAVPVIADANSMTYVLHLKLGDELILNRETDNPVRLRVVAALADSILQGELLMSERNFLRVFPEQEGYRFFLLDVAPDRTAEVAAMLEDQLSDFGFDVIPTGERLETFHRVENTYLSTFQTLGGLGLTLGTLGLATVLLRNVLERRRELALLRAVGYKSKHFAAMVVAENVLLILCGLVTGTVCALLAIAPAFFSRGGHLPTLSLGLLLLGVVVTGLAASLLATAAALRSPLLPALRAE